jgi:hypothetical protein
MKRILLLGALFATTPVLALTGQTVTVRGVRGLAFGTVVPGIPSQVLRTDPVNSGQFEIRGPFLTFIRLTFTLPPVLNGPLGATMPLSFGATDAGYSYSNSIGSQTAFNPAQPFSTLIWIGGRSGVWIGGTASPAPSQRAGAYTGTITLTVVVL